MRTLDISSWKRRAHFEFFRDFANPRFDLCGAIDVAPLYRFAKDSERSFFLSYLFLSLRASNEIEEFRYRLRGEEIVIHEQVCAGTTILLPDDTFTFCYFDVSDDFAAFHESGKAAMEASRAAGVVLDSRVGRDDVIYHSIIPWFSFTNIHHPRAGEDDSVPKIAFGKPARDGERLMMPVAVEANHKLMDAVHIGHYLQRFEAYCTKPEQTLS